MADVKMITLLSSDGKSVQVTEKQACMSMTISNMLEDVDDSDEPIPLMNVSSEILEKVVKFCEKYENEPQELSEREEVEYREKSITGWDKSFVDVPLSTLFEMILAANFLDIKLMLNLTCKAVADMIKGKTPEEIKTLFGVKGEFTAEEKQQVIRDNPWLQEDLDTTPKTEQD